MPSTSVGTGSTDRPLSLPNHFCLDRAIPNETQGSTRATGGSDAEHEVSGPHEARIDRDGHFRVRTRWWTARHS
jgi:hypothetical protein